MGVLGLRYSALVIIAFSPKRKLNAKQTAPTETHSATSSHNEINGERVGGRLKKIFKHRLIQPLMRSN